MPARFATIGHSSRSPDEFLGMLRTAGVDLLVDGLVVVELKAVEKLLPIHQAQILTYLKLTGCRVGLLLNFNVKRLKDGGIQRFALNLQ